MRAKDWWDKISDDEKKSIEMGIDDSKKGSVTPHSEARKIYERWL